MNAYAILILVDGEIIRHESSGDNDIAWAIYFGWCRDERRKDHEVEVTIQMLDITDCHRQNPLILGEETFPVVRSDVIAL